MSAECQQPLPSSRPSSPACQRQDRCCEALGEMHREPVGEPEALLWPRAEHASLRPTMTRVGTSQDGAQGHPPPRPVDREWQCVDPGAVGAMEDNRHWQQAVDTNAMKKAE